MALILTSKYKTFLADLVIVVMLQANTGNTTTTDVTTTKKHVGPATAQDFLNYLSGICWPYTNLASTNFIYPAEGIMEFKIHIRSDLR